MSETEERVEFAFEGKVRSLEPLGAFRMIAAHQHPQTLGPTLQEAWRCREDGKIEWRTVPTQWLTVAEYLAETNT
jgi:hypothetical protein